MKQWILVSFLALAACVDDVGEGKVKAEVEDVPAEAAEAGTPEGEALKLAVDASRSKLGALGAKISAKHPIDFPEFTGTVSLAGDQVSAIAYEAEVSKLTTDHPKLQKHLLDEDFFFVQEYPKATFQSVEVKQGAEAEGMTHTVVGDLTIRGKTKRVTFPAKIEVAADVVKASTEFVIDRQDFGVTYPGRPDDLVQDNVVLTVDLVAPRS